MNLVHSTYYYRRLITPARAVQQRGKWLRVSGCIMRENGLHMRPLRRFVRPTDSDMTSGYFPIWRSDTPRQWYTLRTDTCPVRGVQSKGQTGLLKTAVLIVGNCLARVIWLRLATGRARQ